MWPLTWWWDIEKRRVSILLVRCSLWREEVRGRQQRSSLPRTDRSALLEDMPQTGPVPEGTTTHSHLNGITTTTAFSHVHNTLWQGHEGQLSLIILPVCEVDIKSTITSEVVTACCLCFSHCSLGSCCSSLAWWYSCEWRRPEWGHQSVEGRAAWTLRGGDRSDSSDSGHRHKTSTLFRSYETLTGWWWDKFRA